MIINKLNIPECKSEQALNFKITLCKIYAQAVTDWTVDALPNIIVNFPNGQMTHGGSNAVSVYNADQKAVIKTFGDMEKDALYLFFVKNVQSKDGDIGGYMPLQRQAGFIYELPNNEIIAHELGHGAFNLRHTFSTEDNAFIVAQNTTDNLMDYKGGTELWMHQWKSVQEPERVWLSFLEDESEAEFRTRTYTNPIYNDNPVVINNVSYNFQVLQTKLEVVKTKLNAIINNLTDEEKLILDLPLIQWKLGFKYGAICIIHWLEGSKTPLQFPYDFFMSAPYTKEIDVANIKEYFSAVRYLSPETLPYTPTSNPNNVFLYNTEIPAVAKAYAVAKTKFNYGQFGYDAPPLGIDIDDNSISWNLVVSISVGAPAWGSFDEVGVALGRFSHKIYIKGDIIEGNIPNSKYLMIKEFESRFTDVLTFKDDGIWEEGIRSQDLACWSKDMNNAYVVRGSFDKTDICLQNNDFIKLKNEAQKIGVTIGGDFFIYSETKTIKNEIQKDAIPLR